MKLLEYGIWTIYVPFFTEEAPVVYRGIQEPLATFGVLYYIKNTLITRMRQCNYKSNIWEEYDASKFDQKDLIKLLSRERVIYAD